MQNNKVYNEDTIVAPITAAGVAAVSVIRLSGPEAISVANRSFPAKDLEKQSSYTLHYGVWKFENRILDEVVLSLFKEPKSYTGENIVEISCHGSPYIVEEILRSCLKQGARMADHGEFSQRAFLNGKMDLTQAEAVADIIASQSKSAHKAALNNLRGGFSKKLQELREQLINFAALMELELDFSEEDVEFADRSQLYKLIEEAEKEINLLIASFQLGNVVKNGIQVAIVGKPNAGKSTLLNALLQEDRAIVSETAGTTRDTIEEVLNIKGVLFRLIDTAGIREHTVDDIESAGVGRSMQKMKSADVVLYLFDVADDLDEIQERLKELSEKHINFIPVGNKTDLLDEDEWKEKKERIQNMVTISAKNKNRIEVLTDTLYKRTVEELPSSEDTLLTNTRHLHALEKTLKALQEVHNGLDNGLSGDLITPDIHTALHFLGSITGEIQTDRDVLGAIFSKFCIGK
ncbi:MAG TPA: tRNA uridine-5-carboxymethylaminomethyl(34) synthesis GTPase MnmE [Chitinophagaceae bacterium]|nr:tRNA uridine-5-carboxymethylaminomethyl(34) synthesis GTPase MnmE [Chitinophagaceae bacterium]